MWIFCKYEFNSSILKPPFSSIFSKFGHLPVPTRYLALRYRTTATNQGGWSRTRFLKDTSNRPPRFFSNSCSFCISGNLNTLGGKHRLFPYTIAQKPGIRLWRCDWQRGASNTIPHTQKALPILLLWLRGAGDDFGVVGIQTCDLFLQFP